MPLQMKRRGKSSPQPKRSLKNRIPSKSVRIGEMYWQNPSTFIGRLTAAIVKKIRNCKTITRSVSPPDVVS